jgi:hypothetical protein
LIQINNAHAAGGNGVLATVAGGGRGRGDLQQQVLGSNSGATVGWSQLLAEVRQLRAANSAMSALLLQRQVVQAARNVRQQLHGRRAREPSVPQR